MPISDKFIKKICTGRNNKHCVYVISLIDNIATTLGCYNGYNAYMFGYTTKIKEFLTENKSFINNVKLHTYDRQDIAQLVILLLENIADKNLIKFFGHSVIRSRDDIDYCNICTIFKSNKNNVEVLDGDRWDDKIIDIIYKLPPGRLDYLTKFIINNDKKQYSLKNSISSALKKLRSETTDEEFQKYLEEELLQ